MLEIQSDIEEVIIRTYSQSMQGHSAYSFLIRQDQGQEILESKIMMHHAHEGKAELIAIVAALRTLAAPSLILLFPYHTSYLSQEFSNLENGIKHIYKPNEVDIFDELTELLHYHDVLIEYSKNSVPETELLKEATVAILKEKCFLDE